MPTVKHTLALQYYKIKKLNGAMMNLYNKKTQFSTLIPVTVDTCISIEIGPAAHRMLMYRLYT